MTTLLERPGHAMSGSQPGRHVVRVLALREGRFILRHPLFLLGIAASVALIWITTPWWQAPVLHRDDARLAGDLLPLAAATLIVCNLAAFRARRHSTEEVEDTTPTTRARRTTAHLAALLVPIATAVVLAGAYVVFLYALGGIWTPSPQELATGPAIVALAAAAGVALARWIPSPLAGPLGVLGFAAWQIRGGGVSGPGYRNWFVPFVNAGNENHIPEVVARPAGWHLAYLAGLAGILAAAALLRHSRRPRSFALLAGALTLSVVGGVMQVRPVPTQEMTERLSLLMDPARRTCETRGPVTYCVFPAYRQWIDGWDEIVRRVLEPVPPDQRPLVTIRQVLGRSDIEWLGYGQEGHVVGDPAVVEFTARLELNEWFGLPDEVLDSGDIPMRLAWGRGKDSVGASLDLALAVARRTIGVFDRPVSEKRQYTQADIQQFQAWAEAAASQEGVPTGIKSDIQVPALGESYRFEGVCSTAGQAREALGIWLALRAVPGWLPWVEKAFPQRIGHTIDDLFRLSDDVPLVGGALNWHGIAFVWTTMDIPFSTGGVRTAFDMMNRGQDGLARAIGGDWNSWIRPSTTLDTLRRAFDLSAGQSSTHNEAPMNLPPICH